MSGTAGPVLQARRRVRPVAAPPAPPPARRRWPWWAAGALVLVGGLLLRLRELGAPSMWGDESYTVAMAQRGAGGMLELFTRESNGLLYYVAAFPVSRLDPAVDVLRAPSVVFGALAIAATCWAGAEIAGRRAGLAGAAVLAVSPLAVQYSQDARFYAMTTLLAAVSFACLARALRLGGRRRWIAYVVASAALSYTSTLAWPLIVLPQAVLVAARAPHRTRAFLAAVAATLAALVPLMALSVLVLGVRDPLYFLETPGPGDLAAMVRTMFGGAGALAAALATALATAALRRADLRRPRGGNVLRHPATVLAAWALIPLALAFVVSHAVEPIFLSRYLIAALPGACLLTGLVVARAPRALAAAALAAILVLSLNVVRQEQARPGEDYRSAIASLAAQRLPAEPVLFDTAVGLTVAGHYSEQFADGGRLVVSEWHDTALPARTMVFDDEGGYHETATGPPSAGLVARLSRRAERIWFVFSEVGPGQGDYLAEAGMGWARRHCAVEIERWSGVELVSASACRQAA